MESYDRAKLSATSLTGALARSIQRTATAAGDHETALPDLRLHRRNSPTEPLHCIFPLGLAFTTQGSKKVQLGGRVFAYGPGESMLTTIDLPVAAQITRATSREPYLAVTLRFDAHALTQAMSEMEMPRAGTGASYEPISVQRLDVPVIDALCRLVQLLDEPRLLHQLAPLIKQEIILRLLTGPHANHLAHLVTAAAPRRQVADTVAWMKQNFAEAVEVDELAETRQHEPVDVPPALPHHNRHESGAVSEAASPAGGAAIDAESECECCSRERSRGLRKCVPVQSRIQTSLRSAAPTRCAQRAVAVTYRIA